MKLSGLTKKKNNYVTYANKGLLLEEDINITNVYYRNTDRALIYKKPTPIKIVKVVYPNSKSSKITEAFFEKPSTLDYCGIYKSCYLDFDAKECNSKTSFPLSNIHKHQLEHIRRVLKLGGISFIIVRFNLLGKNYVLFGNELLEFIDNNDRKSIPYEYFVEKGYLVELKYSPRLDYLDAIDLYLSK